MILLAFALIAFAPVFTRARQLVNSRHTTELHLGWRNVVRQTTLQSCGPAVLAMIAGQSGFTEHSFIAAANFGAGGITLAEFERLAELSGTNGSWYQANTLKVGAFQSYPTLHLERPSGHFVRLIRQNSILSLIEDPSFGLLAIPTTVLHRRWSGYIYGQPN